MSYHSQENTRHIASTDVTISPLTLGTVKFGRKQSVKYPSAFDLPSNEEVLSLLSQAQDAGINALDTAPAYGIAEERLGKLLKNRHQWTIISKAGEMYNASADSSHYDYSAKALTTSLHNSLERLNTDYLDCWMLHSDGQDIDNLSDEVLRVFEDAKTSGKVRATGASTKTVEGGKRALMHMDCIMMAYSLKHQDEANLFTFAKQQGKSLLFKKIFDSGWALTGDNKAQIMTDTYQQIFSHQASCSAVIGTINPKHLQENIDALTDALKASGK